MEESEGMKTWNRILYGGDYNPNQWKKEVWGQDMELFADARINSATINVFSWAKIQPAENTYDFRELDEIIDMLSRENYDIVLATSTAALPAWMFQRYPEVGRTDFDGRRHKFGQRHNACPNSLVYQTFARRMAGKLAARYGSNEHIKVWHINNEYGGECFCENCEKAFRVWLKERYGTIDALNQAWNMEFWGHTVYDWDEIVLPNALSEGIDYENTAFAGISVDYRRFMSDSILNNFKMERDAIREVDQETPVTTNLMGTYKYLDYFKWAKEMDVVSWDCYPAYDTPWSMVAMQHDLMRGLKAKPFMLMEQTPSQQNWQPYNSLKRPGQMRAQSYQTIAHGADTILFFQLRRSVGACEKFHGAVIGHSGAKDTRVFREVSVLGKELEQLGDLLLDAESCGEVGLIFDWDNYWALEYTSGPHKDLNYVEQIHRYYRYFYENNIPVDLVPVDGDFSKYKVLAAPVLYMVKPGMKEKLEEYVKDGGVLVTGFMSGIVGDSDNVHLGGYPGPLREMAGIWVEEIDALPPGAQNRLVFPDGTEETCSLLCDLIRLEGAESLAEYGCDFYAGTPAVTKNKFGKGSVYYVGASLEDGACSRVMDLVTAGHPVFRTVAEKTPLEVTVRKKDGILYYFVMNFSGNDQPLPGELAGKKDLLTGRPADGAAVVEPYGVFILADETG